MWLIPIGFFALYLGLVRLILKVTPDSISQTAKLWPARFPDSKYAPWYFSAFGVTVGGSTMAVGIHYYDLGMYKDLTGAGLMLSGFCLAVVGVILKAYWQKDVSRPHVIWTIVCMALGTLSVVNQLLWWALIPVAILLAALWYINFKLTTSKTYWTEVSFGAGIYLTLLIIPIFSKH